MSLYIKKDDKYIPVEVSYFNYKEIEKAAFIAATVGNDNLIASNGDLQEAADSLREFGLKAIILPHYIKLTSFEVQKDNNYLFIVTIPNTSSKELEEQTKKSFEEFFEKVIKFDNISFKIITEDIQVKLKEKTTFELPSVTQQELIHVDGTPDHDYVLRILRTYRENCNCKWETNVEENILINEMNKHQDQRAKLLDEAIEILRKAKIIEIKDKDGDE